MNDAALPQAEALLIEANELATSLATHIGECQEVNNRYYENEDEDNPQEPPRGEEEARAMRLQHALVVLSVDFTRLVRSKNVTEEDCDEFATRLNDIRTDASDLEGFDALA